MLTEEKDATFELEKVFSRLLILMQHRDRGDVDSIPTKWIQCKLYDLLTLSEKALERRQYSVLANPQCLRVLICAKIQDSNFFKLISKIHEVLACKARERPASEAQDILYH
ncbi:hypothetical protein EVAR_8587_1 [Eumeta japonica]|uniref:Uncharacterized protein n=1 Tax=Eumeta variegata TaxID=151549 RepID=A0A4C2AA86_EUMVA|nr:hypothetical protein EVAR_8587_1 [Eumeta japonica]